MASQKCKAHTTRLFKTLKRIPASWYPAILVCAVWLLQPAASLALEASSLLSRISAQDALLVASPDGHIIYKKNETRKCIPASTLKILTALAAIHHLGTSYRFQTEFYQDPEQSLKVKGYGDPLLISEVWQKIAQALAARIQGFKDLILDDTYFVHDIRIPGVGDSTNPYDAPNGALCANFNTFFFKRDDTGRMISAEPQTPLTPFALERLRLLGSNDGRYTICHNGHDAARYAGELLAYFLKEKGKAGQGEVRVGMVDPGDRLVYTYHSIFTLGQALKKMFEFSSNFMANQILIALGAYVHGPPGTLAKGVRVLNDYAREVLHLNDIEIADGSGISRKNRLSALDMFAILKRFEPHRALLVREGQVFYKSGTLRGVKTRAGYIEGRSGNPYYFIIFLNSSHADIDSILDCVTKSLDHG
ncbi:MAG: D-alanyl-D-alanine carboxypeptidase [Deltaproteobacteria bacterium]|nr:D-alanyl-D-alanine carboxypeptidase [Deltaproteobacteria bacterium]MBW2073323.1 D-alanyl-D-alanine carboxypeptidase [Deltaproteobacteria bacterium]